MLRKHLWRDNGWKGKNTNYQCNTRLCARDSPKRLYIAYINVYLC